MPGTASTSKYPEKLANATRFNDRSIAGSVRQTRVYRTAAETVYSYPETVHTETHKQKRPGESNSHLSKPPSENPDQPPRSLRFVTLDCPRTVQMQSKCPRSRNPRVKKIRAVLWQFKLTSRTKQLTSFGNCST